MKTLFSLFILLSFSVMAKAMDDKTRDEVISRLTRIHGQLEQKNSAWTPTSLRLADLLAERARLRFMKETEKNCNGCDGSKADRTQAIGLYEAILGKTNSEIQGTVILQLSHLYVQSGNQDQAIVLLKNALSGKKLKIDATSKKAVRVTLADLYFSLGKNKEALNLYSESLRNDQPELAGLLQYRVAWCLFHLNKLSAAISTLEKVAGDAELLKRSGTNGLQYDSAFHQEVVKDLATFYSRRTISTRDVQHFHELSPLDGRSESLLFFAGEANRVGQKDAAKWIYTDYLNEPKLSFEQTIYAKLQLAQIESAQSHLGGSLLLYSQVAKSMQKQICEDKELCLKIQKQMKSYVTEMHREQKAKISVDVAKAYQIYSSAFPTDLEMLLKGSQVAMDLKQYRMAANLYRGASTEALRQLGQTSLDQETRTKLNTWSRTAILSEIEAAELTQDLQIKKSAYEHAIAHLGNDTETFSIRYQLAQLYYESKNWQVAQAKFQDLALDKSGSFTLRKKSADLALDCLAVQKKDTEIESLALNFAHTFPQNTGEFLTIAYKSILTQSAAIANNTKSQPNDFKLFFDKLKNIDSTRLSAADKKLRLKNMLVLARQTKNNQLLQDTLEENAQASFISKSEREEILSELVGLYEAQLQFAKAYDIAKKLSFHSSSAADREHRLGILADLSGNNPEKHYRAALKLGLQGSASLAIRTRLIERSSSPVQEFQKHKKQLLKNPSLYAETLLVTYASIGAKSNSAFDGLLSQRQIQNLPTTKFIKKFPFLFEQDRFAGQVAGHRLTTTSDRHLQNSLKTRVQLLKKADLYLKKSLALKDFTSQIISLRIIGTENKRMADDIRALPLPKGLKENEIPQYRQLLNAQALPYEKKAQIATQKLAEVASQSTLKTMLNDFDSARPEVKGLLRAELEILKKYSPNADVIEKALDSSGPSTQDLALARLEVSKNPNDINRIEKLKNLETKIGHPLMSAYLQTRFNSLKKGEI